MSGTDADPAALEGVASRLCTASDELEATASTPPVPEAGGVTELFASALQLLTQGVGNVSESASGVGDAVRQSRDLYVETDYNQAVALARQQADAEQPR